VKLSEEIDLIEQRMLEEREASRVAVAAVAFACVAGLGLCWAVAILLSWVQP
jgi:hypothetical protein